MLGKGIECTQEFTKLFHLQLLIVMKKDKKNFINIIKLLLNAEMNLITKRVRKFSKYTRRHIINQNIIDNVLNIPTKKKLFTLIEKMTVQYESHRNVKGFRYKFINNIT